VSINILYFSNYSGNTKKFVEKLTSDAIRIPILWDSGNPLLVKEDYVLCVPTYGGGNEKSSIPKQVKKFLNIPANREKLRGVVGLGNTNFGEHFCIAADMISQKTGVPLIAKVEIFGTDDDINKVKERLGLLYG
jgi:protein involved in ribonucleotide reduction